MPDVPTSWDYTWGATPERASGDAARGFVGFVQNPVGTVAGMFGARRGEPQAEVRLDTSRGLVEVGGVRSDATPLVDPGATIPLHPRARAARGLGLAWQHEERRRVATALAEAFRTGSVTSVPRQYVSIAEEIAGIGRAQAPLDSAGPLDDSDVRFIEGGAQRSPPGPEFFMPRSIPGGAFGMAQQVPATVARVRGALGGGGTRRARRSRTVRTNGGRPRRRRRSSGKAARFVKGSAAAKAHMARLRKMRRRKK